MAADQFDEAEEPILLEEEEEQDNAEALTSGLVFGTFALLVLAFFVLEKAIGTWFDVGWFK